MFPTIAFRDLSHRNFRLYFFGQGVSILGTWMQQVAVAWLVYCLTNSAAWLGLVAFAGQIPCFVVAFRRSTYRPRQSPPPGDDYAGSGDGAGVWPGRPGPFGRDRGLASVRPQPARRRGRCVRHTGPPVSADGNGRDGRQFGQRHCLEFVDFQRGSPDRAGSGRALLACTSSGVCFLANGISFLAVLAALRAVCRLRATRSERRAATGRGWRRFQLCMGLWSHPFRVFAFGLGEHGSDGFVHASAVDRHVHSARRLEDTGHSYSGHGSWGAGGHDAARSQKNGRRAWQVDRRRAGAFRAGTGGLFVCEHLVGFGLVPGAGWIRVAAAHGCQQHGPW